MGLKSMLLLLVGNKNQFKRIMKKGAAKVVRPSLQYLLLQILNLLLPSR